MKSLEKPSYTIPIAIMIGGIIVAGAVYVSIPKRPMLSAGNPALVRPIDSTDHIFGNPAAKVIIVEYADFDCEYCKGFNDTMHQVIASGGTTGKVAWVFREFPLSEIHPNALAHARAAECAAQTAGNDAFWRFETELFNQQPVDPTNYGTIAKAAGLPADASFATCYATASTTVEARVLADRQNALSMGAQGTPYSLLIVNGKPPLEMGGNYSYESVRQLVDQALSQ